MANDLLPAARTKFLTGEIDWVGDDFVVALLDASYTYNDADEFAADLTGVLATAPLTGTAALAGGVADAADVSVSGVIMGQTVTQVMIWRDTGSPATDDLIYYADENDDGTLINRAGDGAAITIPWSASPDRVFRL